MRSQAQSRDHDGDATTRFTLALWVVAELLCTGAFIAWVVL